MVSKIDKNSIVIVSGAGNKFILVDCLTFPSSLVLEKDNIIIMLCSKDFSGEILDGVIFLKSSQKYDYRMTFYNNDSTKANMCGNASRAISLYAVKRQLANKLHSFESDIGVIFCNVFNSENISVKIPRITNEILDGEMELFGTKVNYYLYNNGLPHFISFSDIKWEKFYNFAKNIRFDKKFNKLNGVNVSFCKKDKNIEIRTYERFVERETAACGTACIAAAYSRYIYFSENSSSFYPISGHLIIVNVNNHDFEMIGQAEILPNNYFNMKNLNELINLNGK